MTIGVARVLTAIAVAAAVIATKAHAQSPEAMHNLARSASFYAATERFGYYGTISVYNNLKDARQEKHARFSKQIVPQRDGSLFVVHNAPNYFDESAAFLTDWYSD